MSDEDLCHQISCLIETAPPLRGHLTQEEQAWVAAVRAAIAATGDHANANELANGMHMLKFTAQGALRHQARPTIMQCLNNALADMKLRTSNATSGAFIGAGDVFNALVAVTKVLAEAKKGILLIDPYADAQVLTTYAIQAPESIRIDILAETGKAKAGLKPAVAAWQQQYGATRPLEARLASHGQLHDRLVVIDGGAIWMLGQSFNALVTRSPTALVRLDALTGSLKLAAYTEYWNSAVPI